ASVLNETYRLETKPKENPSMSFTRKLITTALLCAALAAFAASAFAATSTGATLKVGSTGLGRVLVTAQGKTLYLWAGDHGRTSTCYGDCAEYWPPVP